MPSPTFIIGDTENPQLFLTIKDLVARWKRKYPREWSLFRSGMEEERKKQLKGSAMDPDGNLQYAMRIPKKLLEQIDFVTGSKTTIEKDDNLWAWFKKEFPEFYIPVR